MTLAAACEARLPAPLALAVVATVTAALWTVGYGVIRVGRCILFIFLGL